MSTQVTKESGILCIFGGDAPSHGCACTNCSGVTEMLALQAELLEALKNLENDNGAIPDHAWKMVQDAIAKAEGKQ